MPKGQFLEHLVGAEAKGGEDGTELKLVRVEDWQVKVHARSRSGARGGDRAAVQAERCAGAGRRAACGRRRHEAGVALGWRRGEREAAWDSGGDGGLDLERERRRCD